MSVAVALSPLKGRSALTGTPTGTLTGPPMGIYTPKGMYTLKGRGALKGRRRAETKVELS